MSVMYIRDKDGKLVPVPTIKGDKGNKGEKGDRGDTYVLTEEDKAEIAEQAAALIDSALLATIGTGEVTV